MKILSIDTSSRICTVAILEDYKLIKEISEDNGLTHSEKLMPMIQEILNTCNLSLKDINLLVCDKGPGSFTGIRIGVATVKGFSDSLNIPSIGISSLESLSYNIEENSIICPLIDAKNNNVYCGIIENADNNYIVRRNFSMNSINNFLEELKSLNLEYNLTFVGDGAINYKDIILQSLPTSKFVSNNNLSAFKLGLAGLNRFKSGLIEDVLPLYLRKSQAERMLENKND